MNEENEEFEREMNYKSPSQAIGDSVAREFADGQEDEDGSIETAKYITVLDFELGIVFQYKMWHVPDNADDNTYERFINNKGHRLNNCEWMVHEFQGFHVGSPVLNTN